MKQVLVIVFPSVEVYSTLVALCKAKGLPYHSLKSKEFPIFAKSFEIHKKTVNR